jgi:hypothetical protein
VITAENLLQALHDTGVEATMHDLKDFTHNTGLTPQAKIDYNTFQTLMLQDCSPAGSKHTDPDSKGATQLARIDQIIHFNVKHLEFEDFSMAADFMMRELKFPEESR